MKVFIVTKQVGWFVVGEGECGQYVLRTTFETIDYSEDTLNYWKSRGYDLVPALVPEEKKHSKWLDK